MRKAKSEVELYIEEQEKLSEQRKAQELKLQRQKDMNQMLSIIRPANVLVAMYITTLAIILSGIFLILPAQAFWKNTNVTLVFAVLGTPVISSLLTIALFNIDSDEFLNKFR